MRILFSLLCLYFAFGAGPKSWAEVTPPSPLPDFGQAWSDSDLAPLDKIIGSSSYIGLGESIHATEGFPQAKARIIKHLVTKKGFRLFAMETPWMDAEKAAAYMATCQGTPKDALKNIFAVWWSKSVAELFQWICDFNQLHPRDPVRFFGFDIQNAPPDIFPNLKTRLKILVPKDAERLMSGLSRCLAYGLTKKEYFLLANKIVSGKSDISESDQRSCEQGIATINSALGGLPQSEDNRWSKINLVGIAGNQKQYFYWNRDRRSAFEARDFSMAETFEAIRRETDPGAKAILWAHNAHLALDYKLVDSPLIWPGANSFGYFLNLTYGSQYVPIALTGFKVSFHWPGSPNPQDLPEPSLGSVEALLRKAVPAHAILNLNSNFLVPGQSYDLGFAPIVPSKQFRGVIYLSNCEAMIAP